MARPEWTFRVLGTLTVERDAGEVELRGRRPREVLALLLLHAGHPVSADRLTSELWGEEIPASARSALHVHLSKLRAVFGDLVERSSAGYALRRDGYELDADRFEQLLADAATSEPVRARALLSEGLGLWRGDALADIECDGALANWASTLQERRLQGTILRIDADLAAGMAGELTAELNQLVGTHPFEERLWGQLMLALYRAERQADALEAYGRARTLLLEELGLDPGTQLRHLHEQILLQAPELRSPTGATAVPAPAPELDDATTPLPPPGPRPRPAAKRLALPQPSTRLIGRDAALLELEQMVDDPFCRLVTLTGLGGVGKTRLAIAHAARWGESFEDGAVFGGLARLTDASQVRAEIAAAISRRNDSSDPNELTLVTYLRDRSLLLVLDNFEHLIGAAGLVAELLEEVPGLKVLVTSRVPLRIRGEHLFEVEPLASGADGDPTAGPAVEMFVQCARALDRTVTPTPADLVTVAGICTALDGLPLAIELAAARSAALTTAQIAAQLSEPLSVGGYAPRDLPDRHQTLEAAIRWSYDLLSESAQRVLRASATFVGPFTPEGLSAVAGADASAELTELLEASLFKHSSVSGRLRLLDLVRAFALKRLTEAGEDRPAREKHRHYLAAGFADVAAQEHPVDPGVVAVKMGPDHADIRVAIEDAVAAGDAASAVVLIKALQPIWMAAQLEESGPLVDAVLDAFTLTADDELWLLRMANFANGYRPTNTYWARRRVTRAGELGQLSPQIAGLSNMIGHALGRQDIVAALALRDELVPLLEQPDIRARTLAGALVVVSGCDYTIGDIPAAANHAAAAVAAVSSDPHPHMLTISREMALLASSAQLQEIAPEDVLGVVAGALEVQIQDLSLVALWLSARYAAGFDAGLAREWLTQAEGLWVKLGGDFWPESSWRDEALEVLGLAEEIAPPLGDAQRPANELLIEAQAWLSARDRGERSPRLELAPAPRWANAARMSPTRQP